MATNLKIWRAKELDIIRSSTVVDLQLINLFSYEYEWFRLALGCCIPCSPSPARLVAIDRRGFQCEDPGAMLAFVNRQQQEQQQHRTRCSKEERSALAEITQFGPNARAAVVRQRMGPVGDAVQIRGQQVAAGQSTRPQKFFPEIVAARVAYAVRQGLGAAVSAEDGREQQRTGTFGGQRVEEKWG